MFTIDYETEAIAHRPVYPPKPVSVAIKHDGLPATFYAWGHPEGNNCTEAEAVKALQDVWASGEPLLFQNGKFDLDVAEVHHGLPIPHWSRIHDTQFLLYLHNPHARSLALKPSAERILDWPPEEQDLVKLWVMSNVAGAKLSDWGAYICRVPADIVEPYCIGDVDRTYALYCHLFPYIVEHGMEGAYDRERELMPILLGAERHGIRVDIYTMQQDLLMYENAFDRVSNMLVDMLGDINYNSGAQLANALLSNGYAASLPLTPTGKFQTNQEALMSSVSNTELLKLLGYRGALKTCLGTFMRPWEAMACQTGRVHSTWHQTRGEQDKGGTRTGRLSSANPNLTNVPNDLAKRPPPKGCPPLPLMRSYLLPEPGHVWLKRDYSSQEIRVLGHFEDGALMNQYIANPYLDPHQFAADLIIHLTGHTLTRNDVKRIAFSILYGSGAAALAKDLGVEPWQAQQFKNLYMAAFPDVEALSRDIKKRGRLGLPVRTVGGRLIFAEAHGGRDFSYKLLNHLIQGSAADITKEGVINYHNAGGCQMLALVHDENNVSCPEDEIMKQSTLMEECMADIKGFDVPLTSDLYVGSNWETAKKVAA